MSIEVVAIGDEILKGITVNTNAAFISRVLNLHGYKIVRQTVLPDHSQLLEQGLKEALSRADFVIATGGLGPTCDDVTRDAAARIFSSPFHTDQTLMHDLRERYGNSLTSLDDQARVPIKARLLKNPIGTAPGLIFSEGGKTLVLLPGVPPEMRPMMEKELLPLLPEYLKREKELTSTYVHFGLLREDDVDPVLRDLQTRFPDVEFGIYPGYGILNIRLTSVSRNSLKECKSEIEEKFQKFVFEDAEGKIEHAIKILFMKNSLTFACAESCTGGNVAAKITSIPGASNFFLGSLVTYSNELKETLLGVRKETLDRYGSVSKEAVLEMAKGLLERTKADYGIAISGIAGPDGGTPEKPVGSVWFAIAKQDGGCDALHLKLRGSREAIMSSAAHRTLFFLWRLVEKGDALSSWGEKRR